MKKKTNDKDAKTPKTGGKRATLRANARARRNGMYAGQFSRTEVNGKRRMRRHLRANPGDTSGIARYEKKYGPLSIELNARGRKLLARSEVAV